MRSASAAAPATLPDLRRVSFGLCTCRGGVGQQFLGGRAPLGDDGLYRAKQKAREQPDQDEDIDRLQRQRGPVDMHRSTHEGIGEQQEQRDDQTVDRHGLDHREANEQRARQRVCRFRLPRDRVHRGGDRAAFAERRADRAE